MWKFFTKITEKQTLTILLVGAALVVLSAFHGLVFVHLPITSEIWIWIVAGLGFLLVLLGTILALAKVFESRNSKNNFKDDYDIKITSHKTNDPVRTPIELRGDYKNMPKPGMVFAVERNDSRHQYYIKEELVFYNNNTWRTQINIGNGDDLPRTSW